MALHEGVRAGADHDRRERDDEKTENDVRDLKTHCNMKTPKRATQAAAEATARVIQMHLIGGVAMQCGSHISAAKAVSAPRTSMRRPEKNAGFMGKNPF